MTKFKPFLIIFIFLINGCSVSDVNRKGISELVGSTGGSFAAYKFSDGDIFTTILGSGVGFLLGSYIGDYLEKNDYYYYKSALLNTLETNQIGSNGYWKNKKSGNEGIITVSYTHLRAHETR